jgi:integrase
MGIYKKKKLYWIDYYADGKRRRESIGPSYKLAQEVLHKRKVEIAEGNFFPERKVKDLSFREMAEIFLKQHAQYKKSAETLFLRTNRLIGFFGDNRLKGITPLMVQNMRNKIKATKSISTANRYHAILRAIFNRAKDWRLFYGENPASVTKLEKEPPNRTRFLNEYEIKKILQSCHPRLLPVVICALTTGMRRGEVLNLKWVDLDLQRGIIYLIETKSGKPREIPIINKLLIMFEDMNRTGEKVFDIPKITLRRYFEKALNLAGIENFRFHDLRHTFASHFIMRTGDLPALQGILGHSTPLLTQRYAHLSNQHLKDNMALLDTGWTPIWTPSPSKPSKNLKVFPKNAIITNTEVFSLPR